MHRPEDNDGDNITQHEGLDDLPLEMWEGVLASVHPGCRRQARLVCRTWASLTPKPAMRLRAFSSQSIRQGDAILLVADAGEDTERAMAELVALMRGTFDILAVSRLLGGASTSAAAGVQMIDSVEDVAALLADAWRFDDTKRRLAVLDGSISARSCEPALCDLYFNGRHLGVSSITVAKTRKQVPVSLRNCFTHVVICPTRHVQLPHIDLVAALVLPQLGADTLRTVVAAMENPRRLLVVDFRTRGGLSAFFLGGE
jgi:hypothetical protein